VEALLFEDDFDIFGCFFEYSLSLYFKSINNSSTFPETQLIMSLIWSSDTLILILLNTLSREKIIL
jgi:hypothetical protein